MNSKKIKVIDSVKYYSDRPESCRSCFLWKNRKTGCMLGKENCYYLAETVKTDQEKKCEGCPYGKAGTVCYRKLLQRSGNLA